MLVVTKNAAEGTPTASGKPQRGKTLRRLCAYAWPDIWRISLGLSALVVNSVTNLSFPWLIGRALDQAGDEDLQTFIIKSGGFFLAGSMASWLRVYCLGSALENIIKRIRLDLFDSLLNQDMEYYETNHLGEVINLLEKDVIASARLLTDKFANGLRALNSSLNGSICLYRTSPKLTAGNMLCVMTAARVDIYSKTVYQHNSNLMYASSGIVGGTFSGYWRSDTRSRSTQAQHRSPHLAQQHPILQPRAHSMHLHGALKPSRRVRAAAISRIAADKRQAVWESTSRRGEGGRCQ
jgi:ABC-type multidrug transport system fused ATPase/permease subunit